MLYTASRMAKQKLKSNNNVVFSCQYHVVFCPKYRRKVLNEPIAARLKTIVLELAQEFGQEALEMEVRLDHVHLLCAVDPQFGIAKWVRVVKGRSSRLLRQEFPELKRRLPTLWTNSYLVVTCGGAPLSVIKQYIENQKGK